MKHLKKKGFTIVELVIVIAVIAVIALALIPTFSNVINKAKESAALQQVSSAYKEALALALIDDGIIENGETINNNGFTFKFTSADGKNAIVTTPDGFLYSEVSIQNGKVVLDEIVDAPGINEGPQPEIDPNDNTIPTYTYTQVNDPAQRYLSEVSYDNALDSETHIAEYVTEVGVYDNPVGYTVELQAGELTVFDNGSKNSYTITVDAGPYTFYNITPGVGGEFWVKNGEEIIQKGHLRPTGTLRMIYTDTQGLQNIRDLGGWRCDGGSIKYNLIIRGGQVIDVVDKDRNTWIKLLGIKHDIFVKTYYESQLEGKEQYRTSSPLGENVTLYQMDLSQENSENMRTYATAKQQMNGIMNHLFDYVIAGETTYFHCLAGADRTGMVAILVEGVLGVSKSDIDKDYELTSFSTGSPRERNGIVYNYNILRSYDGATFRDKCINYLLDCGISLEKINAFRKAAINGNPQEITLADLTTVTYSITSNLQNCTIDNNMVSIKKGLAYSATITPNNGYNLTSVIVTMGANNIPVTNGVINIEKVTGDIIISALGSMPGDSTPDIEPKKERINFCIPNAEGWISGGRCSSEGANRTDAGSYIVTNYFVVQNGDTIYIKDLNLKGTDNNHPLFSGIYKASESGIGSGKGFIYTDDCIINWDATSDGWQKFTINYEGAAYMRLCGVPYNGDLTGATIIINIQRNGEWLTVSE